MPDGCMMKISINFSVDAKKDLFHNYNDADFVMETRIFIFELHETGCSKQINKGDFIFGNTNFYSRITRIGNSKLRNKGDSYF